MCLNSEMRLRFLGIVDKRAMANFDVKKIGVDTDEEEEEAYKPVRGKKGN